MTAVRRELEPIARGTEGKYSRYERKAAFSILNELERLERETPNHRLTVSKDWHHALREPGELKAQIAQARTVERERAPTLERERGFDHGRGLGR